MTFRGSPPSRSLLGQSGHRFLRRKCLLLTQSGLGHIKSRRVIGWYFLSNSCLGMPEEILSCLKRIKAAHSEITSDKFDVDRCVKPVSTKFASVLTLRGQVN